MGLHSRTFRSGSCRRTMAVGAFRGFATPCNSTEAYRTRMGMRLPFLLCRIYCRGLSASAIGFRRPAPELLSVSQVATGFRSGTEFEVGSRRYPAELDAHA